MNTSAILMPASRTTRPRALVLRYEGSPFLVRMSKVIRTILDAGWDCDVMIPEGGLGATNVAKEMGRDLLREVTLHEIPMPDFGIDRLGRGAAWIAVFRNRSFERYLSACLQRTAYDAVLVKDTPCLATVFRCVDRLPRPRPVVLCDMYETVPEQMHDKLIRYGGLASLLRARAFRLLPRLMEVERAYLPRCAHTFVVVQEAKELLLQRYPVSPERISVVHNVEHLEEFDGIQRGDVPAPGDRVRVSYVGSFGPHRGLEGLVKAAAMLSREADLPAFEVVLVGASATERARFERLAEDEGAARVVRVLGMQSHRTAMQWIKASDIGVISHADTPHIRTTIPNKLFQYMSAGVGVLCTDVGPLGRIVRQTGCGLLCQADSPQSLATTLGTAIRDIDEVRAMGVRGRQAVQTRYRWELEGQHYTSVLDAIATTLDDRLVGAAHRA